MKRVAILVLAMIGLIWVGNVQAKPVNLNFLQRDVDQAIEQLAANLSEYNPQAFENFYQSLQRSCFGQESYRQGAFQGLAKKDLAAGNIR